MVTGHARLGDNNPTLRRLIEMRNPHVDPINVMQASPRTWIHCIQGIV